MTEKGKGNKREIKGKSLIGKKREKGIIPIGYSLFSYPFLSLHRETKGNEIMLAKAGKKRVIKGNSLYCQLTAPPFAGYLSFLIVKLARFLHVLEVKSGCKRSQKSLIMVRDNYVIYTYHNHEIQIPRKTRNNHNLQMINDLQSGFELADNFLRVQGCKPKVALLARLASVGMIPVDLTASVTARLQVREG